MKSIFDESTFKEIEERIVKLDKDTKAHWGKMSAGQMVWHCQAPLNIILQKDSYGMKPNWLFKTFFKKSMYSDKLWRKNLPTAKAFRPMVQKDYNTEKQKLMSLLYELYEQREKEKWDPHPSFGHFTKDQWGKTQYKHLDHHLRQFGV